MKKIIALVMAVAIIASMGIVSSMAVSSSLDQICGVNADGTINPNLNFAKVGENTTPSDLGDITASAADQTFMAFWGWHACASAITSYGYSVNGGEIVWNEACILRVEETDPVWTTGVALGGADVTRFYVPVPIYQGEDVTVDMYVKAEDGEELLWTATYTCTDANKPAAPGAVADDDTTGGDSADEDVNDNVQTADSTAIVFMIAAAALVATVVLKKRAF